MKKSYIPLRNTLINSFATFLSRVTGVIKFNVVNYLFGAGADTFYSANANILALRKVLGEGPLVNSFLPVFSKYKNEDALKADKFASNIFNQITLVSAAVVLIGMAAAPYWTRTFLPGFDEAASREITELTVIMLISTVFFAIFSIAMGILNAHERFVTSSTAPVISNIVFIVFPLMTYHRLGVMSLAWAIVIGSFLQCVSEGIELYIAGYRYSFYMDFKDPKVKQFWRLFFPTAGNYLAQSGISIGLGYFASFLPRGSMTYLRNANTIMNAPIGFIGVAISGAIFPIFAKVRDDYAKLAEAWTQGVVFFLFASIPISFFFLIYPDVIVNMVFRDISRFFSGSTGKFTDELLYATIDAVKIMSTVIIPWSLNIMVGKLFYSLEKPMFPLILIIINFVTNIFGYHLSRVNGWGGDGLVYSDLLSGWFTLFSAVIMITILLPQIQQHNRVFLKFTGIYTGISLAVWAVCYPIYRIYINSSSAFMHLLLGSVIFTAGLLMFGLITHYIKINPMSNRNDFKI